MSIKVLYVEDELFLGKIVKETLEGRGFEVNMESDGKFVMKKFKETQPDICVLDVMLPNRNGFELAVIWNTEKFIKNFLPVFISNSNSIITYK